MPRGAGDRYLSFERGLDRLLGPPLVVALSLAAPRGVAAGRVADPDRILLIKLHGIGNIVLCLPALRLIRRRFPAASIDFLSFSTNAGILEGTPELSRVLLLDRTNLATLASSAARVVPRLVAASYGLVVDFDQFAHLATLAALATRAPRRVGFLNPGRLRNRGYTQAVPCLDAGHVSRCFAALAARVAGLESPPAISGEDRRIALEPRHHAEAAAFEAASGIRAGEAMVLLHPGTSENLVLRRWPAERFAALGDRLAAMPGVRVVISGGPGESPLVERVRGLMRGRAVTTPRGLSLKGFVALCARAELVVAGDTAAVHIASAMGTPVAGIYGPNTPALYGPVGAHDLVFYHALPCSPCITNANAKVSSCRAPRCVEAVTAEAVFEGVRATYFGPGGRLLPAFGKKR